MTKIFAKRLKQARSAAGMSQEALAGVCGIAYNTVYFLEKGRNLPNLYTAILIADVLNVSIDWLVGRDEK